MIECLTAKLSVGGRALVLEWDGSSVTIRGTQFGLGEVLRLANQLGEGAPAQPAPGVGPTPGAEAAWRPSAQPGKGSGGSPAPPTLAEDSRTAPTRSMRPLRAEPASPAPAAVSDAPAPEPPPRSAQLAEVAGVAAIDVLNPPEAVVGASRLSEVLVALHDLGWKSIEQQVSACGTMREKVPVLGAIKESLLGDRIRQAHARLWPSPAPAESA